MNGALYMGSNTFAHATGGGTYVGTDAGNLSISATYPSTGVGPSALNSLTSGIANVAVGPDALTDNTSGDHNCAFGYKALASNTDGDSNVAIGSGALESLTSGDGNIAVGGASGWTLESGDNNIYIGNFGDMTTESDTIRIGHEGEEDPHTRTFIAAIYGVTVSGGTAVYIDGNGQLGTTTSSARFKTGIADLGSTSGVLYNLRPVTFQYKPEIDPLGIPQYGLIAEEVAEVAPDLVIYDEAGDPYTVRYEQLVPMLLNELQRLRERVDSLEGELAARN